MSSQSQTPIPERQPPPSRRWIGPLLLLVLVMTPLVILIGSNTDTATVAWARWEWDAPRWVVLTATFIAGVVGGKLFGWLWRSWRRRRRRLADERSAMRRVAGSQGG